MESCPNCGCETYLIGMKDDTVKCPKCHHDIPNIIIEHYKSLEEALSLGKDYNIERVEGIK